METPLLQTKLYIPPIRAELVSRPRLLERLNEGLSPTQGFRRKLTLVSAPAGFGKTTLVSEWIASGDRSAAWLSLDEGDNDPARFLVYFIAALQTLVPNLGKEVLAALQSPQPPPDESLLTALLNEIVTVQDNFVLVLDDYHVIDTPAIDEALTFLLEYLPPQLHLVIATREDPPLALARLQANNELIEIRAGDLRFAKDDAEHFLNEVMGLSLSQADIAVLEDKTEGWIVGLQLAGLSILDRPDPSSFIAALSGSHRFILNYLTEEVLNQQPKEIQQFLQQTSILDKLNADLCNAVTRRADSRFVLERLLNANLFLIPLDDEQQWYRYHHLFTDLLRGLENTFQKDSRTELHLRASRWYARAGMVSEAIQHALAATDYAMAVSLLEAHASAMIMQGYAKSVHGFVQAIPVGWQSHSPKTNLAFAWMHLLRGTYAQASPYLERLEVAFADPLAGSEEGVALKAEWFAMRALLLNMQGKATASMNLITQALAIVPESDSRVSSLIYYAQAGAHQVMNHYTKAVEAYQMAIRHGRMAENFVAEMMSVAGLANLALEHGQLRLAFEIASPASARAERSGSPSPIRAVVHGVLGQVYYQWYQVEEAREHILRAIQLSTLGGYGTGTTFYRVLLSRLLQIEEDLEAATRECQEAVDLMQPGAPTYLQSQVISQQVRVYLARNLLSVAEMTLQGQEFSYQDTFSFPDLPPDQNLTYPIGLLYNSSLHVLLHQAQIKRDLVSLRLGIELADNLIAIARQGQYVLVALEALLLRAQMHATLGNDQASRADYVSALGLAEPEGFIGIFIEQGTSIAEALADLGRRDQLGAIQPSFVKSILAAFPQSRAVGTALDDHPPLNLGAGTPRLELIEPLTERELEVLCLMAEGLKYQEIATRLFISLNTVRSHVKAIYRKLNVNNRTKAIELAHQLQLL